MKRISIKVAILALAAALVLGLGTISAAVEPVTTHPVWVGSTQVTSASKDDIPGITGGKASYDPDTCTLTFTGDVTAINRTHQLDGDTYIIGAEGISLTLVVNDSLTLSGGDACMQVANSGSLTISGPGVLNVTGPHQGIHVTKDPIISGGTVTATSSAFII